MISSEMVRKVHELIAPYKAGPVLSLYADLDPSKPENSGKAYLLRAKQTLKDLGVQESFIKQVLECLEHAVPFKKTRAIFVSDQFFEYFDFQVDLPVVDLAQGRLEARLGEPYITPILLALDTYTRYGIVFLSQERWRFFEVYMMEIEEIKEAFLTINLEDWRRYTQAKPPAILGKTGRGGSGKDLFDRRLLMWVIRFYKQAASLLEQTMKEKGIDRLVLLGPKEDASLFLSYLPKGLQQRTLLQITSLANLDASPGEILKEVHNEIVQLERKEEFAILDRIKEEGVWGVKATLEALQEGRVYLLALPWKLSLEVFVCRESRLVLPTLEEAKRLCSGDFFQADLKDIIWELSQTYGASIEFFQDKPEVRLIQEFGGLAGLKRW